MLNIDALRFPGDEPSTREQSVPDDNDRRFFAYDLLASDALTPGISACFALVCSRLGLEPRDYLLFVFASPVLQAQCTASSNAKCVVRVSSALVQNFDGEELCFVLGHELGHFLLGHLDHGIAMKSIEDMALSRARELSADRIGLLACDSLAAALSAMIKTVSGLSSEHLRFDVSAFLSQISKARGEGLDASFTTHPNFLIRARALLWFSTVGTSAAKNPDTAALIKANKQVLGDIQRYIDAPAEAEFEQHWADYSFWFATMEVVRTGQFSKRHQEQLNQFGGRDKVLKLKGLLSGTTKEEAIAVVSARLTEAEQPLSSMWPKRFTEKRRKLAQSVGIALSEAPN